MTTVLPLSAYWMIISLFCFKELRACNSALVKLFLGLFLSNEVKEENAVSRSLDFMDFEYYLDW